MKQELQWYEYDDRQSVQENRDRRLMSMPILGSAEMEVLKQCQHPLWDGNVASKAARTELFNKGLIVRFNGWQILSVAGLAMMETLGLLDDRNVWRKEKR